MPETSQEFGLQDWPVSQRMLDAGREAWHDAICTGASQQQILNEVYLSMAIVASIEEVEAETENAA